MGIGGPIWAMSEQAGHFISNHMICHMARYEYAYNKTYQSYLFI